MNEGIRAELAILIHREKKANEELDALREELALWRSRVDLAREKGMTELAEQADARVEGLRHKGRGLKYELETIEMDKETLRKEGRMSRGPTGQEVRRAEALLDSFRDSGLVDPEEAALNRELRELQSHMDVEKLKREDD